MSGARLLTLAGADIVGDVLGNLFTDCAVGAPVTYAFVQVVNATTGALTGSRTWLDVDSAGAVVNLAVADGGVARAGSYSYGSPAVPTFGAVPTSYAAGLSLPDLAVGQKCLICVRRDPTSATTAYPERNAIRGQSTGPA